MYTYPTLKNTKYISNIDISEDQINSNTVIEGDFCIPFSIMNIKSRQKINKKKTYWATLWKKLGLTDTFRTFHPNFQNTLSPQAHRIFYKTGHMLDNKS